MRFSVINAYDTITSCVHIIMINETITTLY